jgi:hypothetical protein
MRRKVLWSALAVALIVTPAIIGLLMVSGNDRRLGATVEPPATISALRLTMDGTEYGFWRKSNWGFDAPPGVKLQYRPLVLERGWTVSNNGTQLLSAAQKGALFDGAKLEVLSSSLNVLATYDLRSVAIASYEHEIVTGGASVERLSLRYGGVTTTP